jgi:Photosynthetic reaction centre cytochrome C subunit
MIKLQFKLNKKLTVITTLIVVVMIGVAGTTAPANPSLYKNLKILPQDITEAQMDEIMDVQFSEAMGVKCDYCHVKEPGADHPDFASDANSKKDIAREMMNMVLKINKDDFLVRKPLIGDSLMVINCYTCHHGNAFPDNKSREPAIHNWGAPPPPKN